MPRTFDQDAKERVIRLVEECILAENMLMQAAGSSSKAGRLVAHGLSMDVSRPAVRETSQNLCLKMWPKTLTAPTRTSSSILAGGMAVSR